MFVPHISLTHSLSFSLLQPQQMSPTLYLTNNHKVQTSHSCCPHAPRVAASHRFLLAQPCLSCPPVSSCFMPICFLGTSDPPCHWGSQCSVHKREAHEYNKLSAHVDTVLTVLQTAITSLFFCCQSYTFTQLL